MCGELCWTFETNFNATAVLDILIVASLFFGASLLLRGTQALPLLRGFVILLLVLGITATLPLVAFRWLLGNAVTASIVAVPVIFQPELRRALERLGRAGWSFSPRNTEAAQRTKIIDDVCAASARLSERRQGALIVLERETGLQEYIDTGVVLESQVSPQLRGATSPTAKWAPGTAPRWVSARSAMRCVWSFPRKPARSRSPTAGA
jgi:diadenylate cyclase